MTKLEYLLMSEIVTLKEGLNRVITAFENHLKDEANQQKTTIETLCPCFSTEIVPLRLQMENSLVDRRPTPDGVHF